MHLLYIAFPEVAVYYLNEVFKTDPHYGSVDFSNVKTVHKFAECVTPNPDFRGTRLISEKWYKIETQLQWHTITYIRHTQRCNFARPLNLSNKLTKLFDNTEHRTASL